MINFNRYKSAMWNVLNTNNTLYKNIVNSIYKYAFKAITPPKVFSLVLQGTDLENGEHLRNKVSKMKKMAVGQIEFYSG